MADEQPLRDLNASGLYSHAAEMASQLPQAKGSPAQFKATLTNAKYGVKPVEMEGFDEAFAGQPSVTRDQLVQHFTNNMPQIERKVLGQKTNAYPYSTADEWQSAINRAERQGNFDESQRLTLAWEEAEGLGGQGAPKFQKYTLPGGENYREVLLKMPESSPQLDAIYNRMEPFINTPNGTSSPEFQTLKKQYNALTPTFKSSHYPDLNILVHTRLSDRTGPNNEKILHVEEIQSDWAQQGRKTGFDTPERAKRIAVLQEEERNLQNRYNDLRQQKLGLEPKSGGVGEPLEYPEGYSPELAARLTREMRNTQSEIIATRDKMPGPVSPSAPYVTNTAAWTDLALKDILREAAEGGYDKVVWTPGVEQAKRYDLSKSVEQLLYSANPDGTYQLSAIMQGRGNMLGETIPADKLSDYVGQEVAKKIVSGEGKRTEVASRSSNKEYMQSLSGDGLKIGGEGMKGYYDKIVPNQLSKLVKKLDPEAKIGRDTIQTQDTPRSMAYFLDWARARGDDRPRPTLGQVWQNGANEPLVQQFMKETSGLELPSITITPKMREALKRGLPAYADGGAVDDEDEGLTAYHGSPHDFEQFDTSKIGTGEGAQAYGHGLYFAESEPVAQEYRDKLTAGTYKGDTGKVFDPFDDLEHMNVRVAAYKSIDNAIDRAKGLLEDQPYNADMINRDLAKLMEAKAQNAQPQTGHMYEVRINAHPDHFLDWDKPLNEQSEHVQNAIKSIANSVDVDPFEHLALASSIGKHPRSQDYSPRGNDLYNDLEEIIGDKTKVSDLLHQNGLRGIRYLDAGSRKDTDQPTRNYVVFNHDHVQVKRKYARGGAIAGA
jgi:hypothetical protein